MPAKPMSRPGPDERPHAAVWVDHRNAILRRGIVSCLDAASYRIAGESAGLEPLPDPARADVLLFQVVDDASIASAAALSRRSGIPLIGILGDEGAKPVSDLRRAGLSAVIGARALTPQLLVAALRATTAAHDASGSRRPRRMLVATHSETPLTDREFDVLRLLADGATTRDIAAEMNYSERTVKNIIHDVLLKLHGRTRAQAVAIAARAGMI